MKCQRHELSFYRCVVYASSSYITQTNKQIKQVAWKPFDCFESQRINEVGLNHRNLWVKAANTHTHTHTHKLFLSLCLIVALCLSQRTHKRGFGVNVSSRNSVFEATCEQTRWQRIVQLNRKRRIINLFKHGEIIMKQKQISFIHCDFIVCKHGRLFVSSCLLRRKKKTRKRLLFFLLHSTEFAIFFCIFFSKLWIELTY